MSVLYSDGEPAGNGGHPSSEVLHDWLLLTQRAQTLACDVINDPVKDRLAELREVNKVVDNVWRLFRQWRRDQISLDEMVTAVRRQRSRLIPDESARGGSHD
jgi:hypothetical protein